MGAAEDEPEQGGEPVAPLAAEDEPQDETGPGRTAPPASEEEADELDVIAGFPSRLFKYLYSEKNMCYAIYIYIYIYTGWGET